MKILMLASEFPPATGGIATYAREIAAAAAGLGADVTVIAPDYSRIDILTDDCSLPFTIQRFRGGAHTMRDAPGKIKLVRDLVRVDGYDVIHAVDWPFFIPLALARGHTDARLLMTVHGTEINEMRTAIKRLAVRAAGVFGARSEVVANSDFTRGLLLRHFPAARGSAKAVPLGVSQFWFGPGRQRDAVRADLRIANDATVLVTVARLTRRKGHLAALTALESLPERLRQKIVWLIVGPDGEGEHVEALRKAAARARLDIRFLGRLADIEVRDLYGAGDLFCLTGSWDSTGRVEGFGLVYLEAGACGLPSVATAVGGVAEAVLSDKTGLVVEPTTEAIAAGLTRLIENPDLRTKLGQAAREYARAMSWRHCAVKTYCLKGLPRSPSVVAEIMSTQSRERGDAQLNLT